MPKRAIVRYLNVSWNPYHDCWTGGDLHDTREHAEKVAKQNRHYVMTVAIVFEVDE